MESRLQALEEKVTRLTERVEQLEQRASGAPLPSAPESWPLPGADVGTPPGRAEVNRWVTFLGRSCLVLGGAFLIRALTDGGVLSAGPGVAMGVAFAAVWLVLAHRAAMAGARLSAGFHAVVAALIAYSLILEATTPTQASHSSWSCHATARSSPVKPKSVSAPTGADIAPRRVVASRISE